MYIDISPDNNTYHNAYTHVLTDNRFTFYTHFHLYILYMTPCEYFCIWQRPEAKIHIEAGHIDSNWPEFTFVFTYIYCLNRLANSLSYLILLFIISLVSIFIKGRKLLWISFSHNNIGSSTWIYGQWHIFTCLVRCMNFWSIAFILGPKKFFNLIWKWIIILLYALYYN